MNLEDRIRNKRKIDPRKVAAIALAIDIGSRIQQEFPQVARDYRSGMYHKQIVRKYDLKRRYNINKETAEQAVAYALGGNSGFFRTRVYPGLIEDEKELKRLEHEHFVTRSLSLVKRRKGIHAQTRKEKIQQGHLGYPLGLGKMTHEELSENCRKGLRERGIAPWTDGHLPEIEVAYRLSQLSLYRRQRGDTTVVQINLLTDTINRLFGNNRSAETVRQALYQYRK